MGMWDYEDLNTAKARREAKAAKEAAENAEYDREQAEQKRQRAERDAAEQRRYAESLRAERDEAMEFAQEEAEELSTEITRLRKQLQLAANVIRSLTSAGDVLVEAGTLSKDYERWEEAKKGAAELVELIDQDKP